MQLRLGFYEMRKKAAWFGSKDDRLYWEQWCVVCAKGALQTHVTHNWK